MNKKILLLSGVLLCGFFKSQAQAPTFTSTPVTTGTENTVYTYPVVATDPNNDPMTFTGTTIPSWLTLTQGGTGSAVPFGTVTGSPTGITIDNNGNTYVAQQTGTTIYKITPDGTTTSWATRSAGTVFAMSFDDHYVYISYYSAPGRIARIDINNPGAGESTVVFNIGGGSPLSIVFRGGFLYAAINFLYKVIKVPVSSFPVTYSAGLHDYITSGLNIPFGLGFNSNGDLYIANYGSGKLTKFNGTTLSDVITGQPFMSDIKIDSYENLYLSYDFNAGGVKKYKPDLSSNVQIYPNASTIYGMALNTAGTLVFASLAENKVLRYQTGAVLSGTPTHADVGVHPVTVSVSDGTNNINQSFNITVTDPNPPTVSGYTPTAGASLVAVNNNLSLTFNEAVKKGMGNITIKKTSDNSTVETIDVTSSRVTVSNTLVTIDPIGNLPALTGLYVLIDGTAIKDMSDNAFAGISSPSWDFQTAAKLNQTVTWSSPAITVSYGSPDFTAATSNNTSIAVTYLNSDPGVATVTGNTIHILKAGTTTITASQAGDAGYNAAADKTVVLTVEKKPLNLSFNANSAITKVYDNSTAAILAPDNYFLDGILGSDAVTPSGTGFYDSKNVGTGKGITVVFVLEGPQKDNYSISNGIAMTTGTITAKPLTVALNATPAISKVYDGSTSATLAPGNYSLTGVLGTDVVAIRGTAAYTDKNAGTGKDVGAGAFVLSGPQKDNYSAGNSTASTTGIITKKTVNVTAADKTRFQGTANPAFTVTYSGFSTGDDATSISTAPSVTTTATASSAAGTYPITPSGGTSTNYTFTYTSGTLTVAPGAPTSVSLVASTVYENQGAGTKAGTLSSTADDPAATFSYSLVGGTGDTDNASFTIVGDEVHTTAALNYEAKSIYNVRVRSTAGSGQSLDQQFTIAINDVNEAPTLAAIADQALCYTASAQTISLSGITAGPESGQSTTLSISGTNSSTLFSALSITAGNGGAATISYTPVSATGGTSTITVTVKDDGGTANGGSDSYTRTFAITISPVPYATIISNIGLTISKGDLAILTASGGTIYQWANASGITSGRNDAVLTIRPEQTTNYQVTVSNSSGCSTVANVTIIVREDYKVEANNLMTPDGDGKNDKLTFENLDMYPNNVMRIFDRAGKMLYEKANYPNDWDGTFQNVPLADDTYFYVLDYGSGKGVKRGYVTIVRNNR
jgi:gliding motility-associated-like protein